MEAQLASLDLWRETEKARLSDAWKERDRKLWERIERKVREEEERRRSEEMEQAMREADEFEAEQRREQGRNALGLTTAYEDRKFARKTLLVRRHFFIDFD